MPLAKLAKLMILPALALSLAACKTAGPATVTGECRVFRPITSSVRDTDQTRREVTGHNRAGQAACGWQPPGSR